MIAKILVVEDSNTDRLIIRNMLTDYNLLLACDGIEAMEKIRNNHDIDLMILDLNMPNMNGFEVLNALKSEEINTNLRTIILTNSDELENEIKGLRLGAVDYIRKPIHMESLIVRIDIHIELIKIRKSLELQLHEQGLTFEKLFNEAPIGIAISYNEKPEEIGANSVTRINPMYEQITGWSKEELIQKGWVAITHPDDVENDLANFKPYHDGESVRYSMEKRYIKPDGKTVWVTMIVAPLSIIDGDKYRYITLIQDITEKKEMENKLRYNYEHDELTGLKNRQYLTKFLIKTANENTMEKRALIGINLNAMHSLTIVYGFQYTQFLLKSVSEKLKAHCSNRHLLFKSYEYNFVFHVSGYKDEEELLKFSEYLSDTLNSMLAVERINAGIGVLEISKRHQYNTEQLLRNLMLSTEEAIHLSDTETKICFYNQKLADKALRREILQRGLSYIFKEEEDDRFFLLYQPIFSLKNKRICGFEALARYNNEELGLVLPLEFIPIIEETKHIIPIGEIIIYKACVFINKLKSLGHDDITVALNVSVIQLLNKGFVEKLIDMIEKMKINPNQMAFELTETAFSMKFEMINSVFNQLSKYGIKLSIDDFGTGYSSLARERELNVDCMKIDKVFIDKILYFPENELITGDIISMAHRLGHCVVAEGVEDEKQMNYLRNHDCDMVQGYLISKPTDEKTALEMLDD